MQIWFGCRDASLGFVPTAWRERSPDALSPVELLDAAARMIFEIDGVERVRVRGYQSTSGPEADMPITLSQRRADAVARALIQRGVDPVRIETITVGAHHSSAGFGDPCPPMEEDRYGYRQRVVEFDVLFCDDVDNFVGSPVISPFHRRRRRRDIFGDDSEPERTERESEE